VVLGARHPIAARTSDGQAVYIDSSIIYRIDPNEVIRIHTDLQNRYVDDYIRPVLRGIIRTEVSQFTALGIDCMIMVSRQSSSAFRSAVSLSFCSITQAIFTAPSGQ
jgi:regulator of protease activity HflC (stomatin/prohibitin superfamily)